MLSSDPQLEVMSARYRAELAERARIELAQAADLIDRFTHLAGSRGVRLDRRAFEYVPTIGIVAKVPGMARALLGAEPTEKEGLFAFRDIARNHPVHHFQAGYFVGSDYMLMAHPCFRRQMNPLANWAPRFIDLVWAFEHPDVEKYIAIDEDRVRINVDDYGYFEADTWYGAPFDEDVRKIESGTVKLRPPQDLKPFYVEFFFAQSHCLDIKWSDASRIKTFQALELKTADVRLEVNGHHYFPARYLHAEFDLSANCFRHFDGAIQFYLEDEYLGRRDSDFNIGTKSRNHIKPRSQKVFKLNGPITVDAWVELCCHFFAANPLTFEYFSGAYPRHVTEALSRIRSVTRVGNDG